MQASSCFLFNPHSTSILYWSTWMGASWWSSARLTSKARARTMMCWAEILDHLVVISSLSRPVPSAVCPPWPISTSQLVNRFKDPVEKNVGDSLLYLYSYFELLIILWLLGPPGYSMVPSLRTVRNPNSSCWKCQTWTKFPDGSRYLHSCRICQIHPISLPNADSYVQAGHKSDICKLWSTCHFNIFPLFSFNW